MLWGIKAYLHDWTVATINSTKHSVPIMTVKRLPAKTGWDLLPGSIQVYAWYRDSVMYIEFPTPTGKWIIPIPPKARRYSVFITRNRVDVYLGPLKAPFMMICQHPRVSVDYSGVSVLGKCSMVLLRSRILTYGNSPPAFIVDGRVTRGYEGRCKSIAVIYTLQAPGLPTILSMLGLSQPYGIVSITPINGKNYLIVDCKRGVISSREGLVVRWEPVGTVNFSPIDMLRRWPHWPYSL